MEHIFENVQTSISVDPRSGSDKIVLGFIDGEVQLASLDVENQDIKVDWRYKLKRSVRGAILDHSGDSIFTISENRALCMFDTETGKRTRCIIESHEEKPNTICLLPTTAAAGQQFATADESGEIKTWDLRVKEPEICKFNDQEDVVNYLATERHTLLSASSDATLAAYEVRARKLKKKSESMNSELLCISANTKYVYVGSGDGHIEVFNNGEYGNILERIESGHPTVDVIVQLRRGLLMTGSSQETDLRLLHVDPNQKLAKCGKHGEGVDQMVITADGEYVISSSLIDQSIKIFPTDDLKAKVPVLSAANMKAGKAKMNVRGNGFFDDLIEGDSDDEVEDGETDGSEDDEEMDEDEEGMEDEDSDDDEDDSGEE